MNDYQRRALLRAAIIVIAAAVACVVVAATCSAVQPAPAEPPQLPTVTVTPIPWRDVQYLAMVSFGVPTATSMPSAGPCPCYADLYNCADFASQYEAQQCYNWCMVQGLGDPHRLDRDADNVACEANP